MGDNGDIREDLRVPENDIGREIESKFEAGDDFLVSQGFVGDVFLVLSIWICLIKEWFSQGVFENDVKCQLTSWSRPQVSVIAAMGEECAVGTKALANK